MEKGWRAQNHSKSGLSQKAVYAIINGQPVRLWDGDASQQQIRQGRFGILSDYFEAFSPPPRIEVARPRW
jgi:hypothetical protein